ncbi:MAG TPA: OsmC family protein [Candidatus Caenarcaniphilales bacterium]|nr:OsmC family protein [Candidatus Caenarcaniphilales bacterium]
MRTVAISWDASAGRFVARGSHAAHQIHVNAPRRADETRRSTGFSATELLLAGAGACSSWDVVEMLRKRRDDVTSVEVTVEGEQASDPPWPYERIVLHFRIGGARLSRRVLERVVRLSCLRYCSVLATLSGVARVEATLEILDEAGQSSGRQPVRLTFEPARRDVRRGENSEPVAADRPPMDAD